jgi:hypothetical protein
MAFKRFPKDPNSVLDYTVDWYDEGWLGIDTIATSTWIVPTGLTNIAESHTTKIATIWLSGGTAGTNYEVTNRITTAGGRTDDRTIVIECRQT